MSDTKRYLAKISWTQIETEEHPAGEFVRWSDYARLQAEVESVRQVAQDNKTETEATRIENARLKTEVDALMTNPTSRLLRAKQAENAVLAIENDSLKAEVERLRKAGDDLADEVIGCYNGEGYDPADSESLRKWNAAKEGKQS